MKRVRSIFRGGADRNPFSLLPPLQVSRPQTATLVSLSLVIAIVIGALLGLDLLIQSWSR